MLANYERLVKSMHYIAKVIVPTKSPLLSLATAAVRIASIERDIYNLSTSRLVRQRFETCGCTVFLERRHVGQERKATEEGFVVRKDVVSSSVERAI